MKFSKKALFAFLVTVSVVSGPACLKWTLAQCLSLFAKVSLDGRLSVREVRFFQGKILFLDVSFCKADASKKFCEIKAPELALSFSWNSSLWQVEALAELKEPQVALEASFSQIAKAKFFKDSKTAKDRAGWIHWQWEIADASLGWQELGLQANISAKKIGSDDFFLKLSSGSSCLEWNSFKQGPKRNSLLCLSKWDLKFLQPCLDWALLAAHFESGVFDGQIELKELSNASLQLSIRGDLLETALSSPRGEIFLAKASLETELFAHLSEEPAFSLNWGRLHYSGGEWQKGGCKIEKLEGALSYCFDLGLQWQSAASASFGEISYPIALSAKGFWPISEAAWLDISLSSSEGNGFFHSDLHTWGVHTDEVRPFWGAFIQECLDEKGLVHEWSWTNGALSCLFEWESASGFSFHTFQAEGMEICHKLEALKSWSCDVVQMHFGSAEKPGGFSFEGLSGSVDLGGPYQIQAVNWSASGSLDKGGIGDSKWLGQIAVCKENEILSFETRLEMEKKDLKRWSLHGSAAEYPFEMQVCFNEALWSIFFEANACALPFGLNLQRVQGHLLVGSDHWNLEDAHADFLFRENAFRFEAFRLQKEREELFLDLRLARGFWDIARLTASFKDGQLTVNPEKTELLGSLLEMEDRFCILGEKASLHFDIPWTSFFLLKELGWSVPTLFDSNLSGSVALDFLYEKEKGCRWALKTERAPWDEREEPYALQIQKNLGEWDISLNIGETSHLSLLAGYEKGIWTIQGGSFCSAKESLLSCQFQGQCSNTGEAKLSLNRFAYQGRLNEIGEIFPQIREEPIDIFMQANGRAAVDLRSFDYEVDFDLTELSLKSERFELKNHKTMHALLSCSKGVMLQGIDCQLKLDGELLADCKAKFLHYRPLPGAWLLHEARLHVPEKSFSMFSPAWEHLNPHQDVALTADFRGSSDFSVLALSMKEGLIPFGGELRHVQNLEFYLDEHEMAADFLYIHQNRDLHCKILADRQDPMQGSLILEDPDFLYREQEGFVNLRSARQSKIGPNEQDHCTPCKVSEEDRFFAVAASPNPQSLPACGIIVEGKRPLQIDWQYQPLLGVTIQSIQGSFPGIEAAFYLQAADDRSHLIGGARLDFKELAPFLPPLIAEFFTELDMGKGYALKGKLEIDRKDLSQISFSGLLSGKQVELCSYLFRTLFANVEIKPEEVKISDLKISDSSGFFKIDEMVMRGKKDELWTFSIPLLSFSEFRPSRLREVGGDEGSISPLVVREMRFRNIQGVLEDKKTYTAEGELYFINSYKRQHTLLDLPSDVLGRIIGLDMELLIPVKGALRYTLKEGLFEIWALEESYSEGERSQFFLANSNTPATLDLDGNLHIQVKMKQYVLFKLTEAFTIFIHGKLKNPQYHLQKKK